MMYTDIGDESDEGYTLLAKVDNVKNVSLVLKAISFKDVSVIISVIMFKFVIFQKFILNISLTF